MAMEKFGFELEVKTNKAKQEINDVRTMMKNFGDKVKMSIGIDTREFTAEQEYLQLKLNDLKSTLQMASEDKTMFSPHEVLEMRVEAEKLEKQLSKTNAEMKNMGTTDFGKNFSKGLSGAVKSVKRFSLALFGVQSVYRILSKASSAYLAQDQETSNKLKVLDRFRKYLCTDIKESGRLCFKSS